ncbi:HIT family protein [Mariniflexile sp. AS56]|uniref:HIT family protein n=1 Tax=Mariniflexile sp. AS56 TaxID=3063957 RepID=UPI0026F3470E|nr:HIT domain-containing protein [Mariniflexile sp. AS56]MDO7171432.1 HIT domain-containing protein [Mariniflexile sp. AS56]
MHSESLELDIEKYCRFCNPPDKNRILFESDNFYVMLSLGPIVEGYLLICSKQHFESCSKIPKKYSTEFDSLVSAVKQILIETYGSCIFYEHGRAGSCLSFGEGSKHCYHAHMHCVPVNVKLSNLIEGTLKPIKCNSFDDFRENCNKYNEPYLFVDDGEKYIYIVVKDIRRQYLRYLTAEAIGKKGLWNWVEHQGWDIIDRSKNKLKPLFNSLSIKYGN